MNERSNYPDFNNYSNYNQNDGFYSNQVTNKMANMNLNGTSNFNDQTSYNDRYVNQQNDNQPGVSAQNFPNISSNSQPFYSYSDSNASTNAYTNSNTTYQGSFGTGSTANSQYTQPYNSQMPLPPVIPTPLAGQNYSDPTSQIQPQNYSNPSSQFPPHNYVDSSGQLPLPNYGNPTAQLPPQNFGSHGSQLPPQNFGNPNSQLPPQNFGNPLGQIPSQNFANTPGSQNYNYNQPNTMNAYPNNQMAQSKSLNPDTLPSVIDVISNDRINKSGSYPTGTRDSVPPLVTTNFVAIDQGTCNPKFIRSSIYSMPATPDMLKNLHIPFVLSISPFAKLDAQEQQIIASDMGEKGPLRCLRCKAYMSPLMTFIDGGRRYQCNLCGQNTEVPEEFFSHLDSRGRRMDSYQRPELCLGSYELLATKEYCKNQMLPEKPAFLFLIDVSEYSIKSGLVASFCRNLKDYILPNLATDYLEPGVKPRVGFITFDRVLHMYNLKSGLTRPQMYTVSLLTEDIGDALVPMIDGLFVDPDEAIDQISMLMESIVEEFQDTTERSVILGPVIQAGMEALKGANNCPGKLFVLHSYLPNADAPGKLSCRDDRTVLGTDKEKNLFMSGSEYYTNLGKSCVEAGVSIDLFLTPSSYMDIATLSELPKLTGGNMFKYDYFTPSNDEFQLVTDLCSAVSKPCAFDAVLKVRTSIGTKAVNYFGNFFMDYTEDVKLACIDADKSVLVEILHNDKLQENENVYIQAATLYTSISGKRRLRIHNTSFPVSSSMTDMFKTTELDTIMNFMCKKAIQTFQKQKPSDVRQEISQKTAQILASYRRNYGEQTKSAELVLPENLKLLPLYANCLIKCDFMQSDPSISSEARDAATDLATDERAYQCFLMNGMNVKQTQAFLYPRLMNLKDIPENSNDFPPSLRDSYSKLAEDGLYLIENGIFMMMWVGSNLDKDWVVNVFNCSTVSDISDNVNLPMLDNPTSKSIHRVIQAIKDDRNYQLKLRIVVQGNKLENNFRKLLVEDKNDRGLSSYVEFVFHIHKEIRTLLNK